jgi:hypothetical protein
MFWFICVYQIFFFLNLRLFWIEIWKNVYLKYFEVCLQDQLCFSVDKYFFFWEQIENIDRNRNFTDIWYFDIETDILRSQIETSTP